MGSVEKEKKSRLNRTFYGIERRYVSSQRRHRVCLNRTFYGIETFGHLLKRIMMFVLIVPFMELKVVRFLFN